MPVDCWGVLAKETWESWRRPSVIKAGERGDNEAFDETGVRRPTAGCFLAGVDGGGLEEEQLADALWSVRIIAGLFDRGPRFKSGVQQHAGGEACTRSSSH